jgi:hypothetical protein
MSKQVTFTPITKDEFEDYLVGIKITDKQWGRLVDEIMYRSDFYIDNLLKEIISRVVSGELLND